MTSNCWGFSSPPSSSPPSSLTPSKAAAFLLSLGRGLTMPSGKTKLHAARLKILKALFTDFVACTYKLDSKSVKPAIMPGPVEGASGLDSAFISSLRSAKYLASCKSDISSRTTSSRVTVATSSFLDPL